MRKCKLIATAMLAAVTVAPTTVSAANGFRQIGYGQKSRGMGGVGIALPQDAFASAANPAGLAWVCDRLDVGVPWVQQKARLGVRVAPGQLNPPSVPQNSFNSTDDFFYPEAAVNRWICDDQSLGLAVYAFGGFETLYRQPVPAYGTTKLGAEYRQYFITPAWSWRMNECQTVGVAVNVAVGWLRLRGLQNFNNGERFTGILSDVPLTTAPCYVTDNGKDFEMGASIRVGWMGDVICGLKVGVTYQSPTWINHFKRYRGFIAKDGDLHLPDIWGLGLTYCVTPFVAVSLDLERIMWTHTKQFRQDIFVPDMLLLQTLGGQDGPGWGWQDQTVVKIGVGWDVNDCLTFRAGFNYGDRPMDGFDTRLNALTQQVVDTHLTLGLTWYLPCCGEVTFSYVHGFASTQRGDQPTADDTLIFDLRNKEESVGIAYGRTF